MSHHDERTTEARALRRHIFPVPSHFYRRAKRELFFLLILFFRENDRQDFYLIGKLQGGKSGGFS
jgi:hypothetical protein